MVCAVLVVVGASGAVAVRQGDQNRPGPVAVRVPAPTITSTTTSPTARPKPTPSPSSPTATVAPMAQENRLVVQNRLYKVGRLPASRCKEPTVRPTSLASVRAYYTQALGCLNKAWAPAIRKAGYQFWAPQLQVYSGRSSTSPCALTSTAVYCNGVIYMDGNYDIKNYRDSDPMWARATMAFLIAHEYGHHVQAMTGILVASDTRESYLSGSAAQLTESRRRELQASCLSGVYLGADKQFFPARGSFLDRWKWTVRNRGDQWNPTRTHGNKTNHGRWSIRGFEAANPSACNTFTAKPATVS